MSVKMNVQILHYRFCYWLYFDWIFALCFATAVDLKWGRYWNMMRACSFCFKYSVPQRCMTRQKCFLFVIIWLLMNVEQLVECLFSVLVEMCLNAVQCEEGVCMCSREADDGERLLCVHSSHHVVAVLPVITLFFKCSFITNEE